MGETAEAARRDRYAAGVKTEVAVARVRAEIAGLHAELVRSRLVAWTDGAVSGRVPGAELFVIKPAGLAYGDLAPENMVLCDLTGRVVAGTPGAERQPAEYAAAHARIYRDLPAVGGIAHAQSPFAMAWAIRGDAIPCATVAIADAFGGEIPAAPLVKGDDDAVGGAVIAALAGHRSPAVLLRQRGAFAAGATPREAVRAIVLAEDAARAVHLATQGGTVTPLDPALVDQRWAHAAAG